MRVRMTEVYRDWINSLKDRTSRARIQVRVDRLVHGNPGQYRRLTEGVCELKIDFGPGYRVYYMERGDEIIILLAGRGQINSTARHTESHFAGAKSIGGQSCVKKRHLNPPEKQRLCLMM